MTTKSRIKVLSTDSEVDHNNYLITTKPNGTITIRVPDEIEPDPEQRKKIQWVMRIFHKDPVFDRSDLHTTLLGGAIQFRVPKVYSGGGVGWVEPVMEDETPKGTPPNGYFFRATGQGKINKIEWREYSSENDGALIEGEKYFGQAVQLHIYTENLYAQQLYIKLFDHDYFLLDPDDDLSIKDKRKGKDAISDYFSRPVRAYTDGEKKIQKVVVNIQLEYRWIMLAGHSLKIGMVISSSAKNLEPITIKDYLTVTRKKGGEMITSPLTKQGNVAVMVGKVATDVARFKPCRYEKITKSFNNEAAVTLFDKEGDINVGAKRLDIGATACPDGNGTLEITIAEVDTYDCNHSDAPHIHQEVIADITALQTAYPDATLNTQGETVTLSFTPTYPYQYLGENEYRKFFFEYFPVFLPKPAQFIIPVQSCAFDKELHLSVHPDVAFSCHLFIGSPVEGDEFSNDIYYRNKQVSLIRGLDQELDWLADMQKNTHTITRFLPSGSLQPYVNAILMDYIKNNAKSFAAGMHGYHSFKGDDVTIMDYGAKYPFLPKTMIAGCVIVSVAVDAIILYLSRGRSAGTSTAAKAFVIAKKIRRYGKTGIKLIKGEIVSNPRQNGSEWSFIWPQVSISRGIGYATQDDGHVALELVEKVVASPLFALQHQMKGTLGSLAAGITGITKIFDTAEQAVGVIGLLRNLKSMGEDTKKANDKLAGKMEPATDSDTQGAKSPVDYLRFRDLQSFLDHVEKKIHDRFDAAFQERFGTKGSISLTFNGAVNAAYELRINVLKQMMYLDVFAENGKTIKLFGQNKVTFGGGAGIDIFVDLKGATKQEIQWDKAFEYIPDFLGIQQPKETKVAIDIEGQLSGSINYERNYTWKVKNQRPTYIDTIIFTGVKSSIYMKVEFKVEEDNRWDSVVKKEIGSIDKKGKKKPIEMILIPAFTIELPEQSVFEKPPKEHFY